MKYGITQQLFLLFVLVIVVSVGVVVVVVYPGTNQQIDRYEQRLTRLELTRVEHWLERAYQEDGGTGDFAPFVEEMAVLYGKRIVVSDSQGNIIADSSNMPEGQMFGSGWLQQELGGTGDSDPFGTVYMNSAEQTVATQFRDQLSLSLNRLLVWGGVLSVVLALPLALLVARPITSAIREISESAVRAGAGDFGSRITRRRHGELGQLARAFNGMVRDLDRAAIQRRNMVADTAHEVRTPISNIQGYVEAMTDGLVSTDVAMRAIAEETLQLTHLADDLQDLALADSDSLSLVLSSESVQALIENAATSARPRIATLGITIDVEVDPVLPLVIVDAQRIVQVLNNLLSNAAAYSPSGSHITVSAAARQSSSGETDEVVIAVSDRGSGIPANDLERVFDRFDRVDPSRVRSTGGTGLGLTIARSIISAHGGEIRAENRAGGGTRLVFTLPCPESTRI